MTEEARTNIVVGLCDQLRAFEIGCCGNEVIRTPNIDRLAAEGVRFELAVTNNPVCMPARSCLLTGLMGRTSPAAGVDSGPESGGEEAE